MVRPVATALKAVGAAEAFRGILGTIFTGPNPQILLNPQKNSSTGVKTGKLRNKTAVDRLLRIDTIGRIEGWHE